ncbi:MAG: insulinase family protein, partial [Chloroflexi bacterium]|nr:insulinase family protein [Chloroflexota bacterium]
TQTRDAAAWAEALDALGAGARLDVGAHAAFFGGQCLAQDLGAYLRLVADAVMRPSFADTEVELVRRQALAEFEEDKRNTRAVVDEAWRELAYPVGHPFRTRALGEERVVRSATTAALRAFHERSLLGGRVLVVVAGGADSGAVFAAAEQAFAGWPAAAAAKGAPVPAARLAGAIRRDVVVSDKTQCDVVMGWHGVPRTDPRFPAVRVTNMVFAQDTFASRAGKIVRDKLGLAYYVFSSVGSSLGQSPWTLRMGVNPGNVKRAIETVDQELGRIQAGEVTTEDIVLATDKLVGEIQVSRESAGGVANQVLEVELYGLGDDYHERYGAMLKAVTRDEVVAIARELLPLDRRATAVAGPALPA